MYKNQVKEGENKVKKAPSMHVLDLSAIRAELESSRLDVSEGTSSSLACGESRRVSIKEESPEDKKSSVQGIPVVKRVASDPTSEDDGVDETTVDLDTIQQRMNSLLGPVRSKIVAARIAERGPPFVLTLDDVQDRVQRMRNKFLSRGGFLPYDSVTDFSRRYARAAAAGNEKTLTDEDDKEQDAVLAAKEALEKYKTTATPRENVAIGRSSYIRRERQLRSDVAECGTSTGTSTDENLLTKLEKTYANRPFGRAQPSRSYHPVLTSLKDTLYEAD